MAKHRPQVNKKEMEGKETVEVFKDLDRGALDTEQFLEKHAKTLMMVFGALVVAVLGSFAYNQFYVGPRNEEATFSYLAAQKNIADGKDN